MTEGFATRSLDLRSTILLSAIADDGNMSSSGGSSSFYTGTRESNGVIQALLTGQILLIIHVEFRGHFENNSTKETEAKPNLSSSP